ncbi:MAG: sugar phosphate isomerase/epimerase family protein [Betaproteobacteria bacterium]
MSWSIGASSGCCLEHGILDVLSAIRAAGIAGVELGTPPNHFDPFNPAAVRDVVERLKRLQLRAVSIHAPFGGGLELSAADARERHGAIGRIAVAASALAQAGGSLVVVHPTDIPRHEADVERRLDFCADSLNALAAICRSMGLRLAVESPLPHLIGGTPEEFAWILQRLDPSAGVCLDTAHTTLGHCWDQFLAIAGARLAHVHASDHHGRFDDHLPPGDGVIDWAHIAGSLRAAGYSGWIMLELKCCDLSHAEHYARAHAQAGRLLDG